MTDAVDSQAQLEQPASHDASGDLQPADSTISDRPADAPIPVAVDLGLSDTTVMATVSPGPVGSLGEPVAAPAAAPVDDVTFLLRVLHVDDFPDLRNPDGTLNRPAVGDLFRSSGHLIAERIRYGFLSFFNEA